MPCRRALDFSGRFRRAEQWWRTLSWAVLALPGIGFDAGVPGRDKPANPLHRPALNKAMCAMLLPPAANPTNC